MVPRHYGIRTERFKLMKFYQFGEVWEFYDLQVDPDERVNQYGNPKYKETIADLKEQLVDLQEKYEDDSDISAKPEAWQAKYRIP